MEYKPTELIVFPYLGKQKFGIVSYDSFIDTTTKILHGVHIEKNNINKCINIKDRMQPYMITDY